MFKNRENKKNWLGLVKDHPADGDASLETRRSGWQWLDGSGYTWTNWKTAYRPGSEPNDQSKAVKIVEYCSFNLLILS